MLLKYNNLQVRVIDIDDQIFEGIALYEDKDTFDEEEDALSIKQSDGGWVGIFESEIKEIEIL